MNFSLEPLIGYLVLVVGELWLKICILLFLN